VYTSDAPGAHDFALLRSLALPDGTVPVASRPGRPTEDCLFADPTRGGRAFKVRNLNGLAPHQGGDTHAAATARSGVVAAFNLQGSAWDRAKRLYAFFEDALVESFEEKAEVLKTKPLVKAVTGAVNKKRTTLAASTAKEDAFSNSFRGDVVNAEEGHGSSSSGAGAEVATLATTTTTTTSSSTAATKNPAIAVARRRRAERRASTTISAADVWPSLAERNEVASTTARKASSATRGQLEVVAWSFVDQSLQVLQPGESIALDLAPKEFEVVTLVPLQRLTYSDEHSSATVAWAPIGLAGMMNAGGTIVSDSVEHGSTSTSSSSSSSSSSSGGSDDISSMVDDDGASGKPVARVRCMGPGQFVAYASAPPAEVRVAVATDGCDPDTLVPLQEPRTETDVVFEHDSATNALFVELSATGYHDITVQW